MPTVLYTLKVRDNHCFTIHHLIPIIDPSSVIISCCLLSLTAARLTNYIILSCCLFSFTETDHTMNQCMPLILSNNIRVRRSGSHFVVGIQSKNGLNADRLNTKFQKLIRVGIQSAVGIQSGYRNYKFFLLFENQTVL